jgi:hypothetical protein
MLLIQQSSSFRVWTSRALMVYFRRALLFLVVSPRQYINNKYCLLQQQQKVYFSDAEDDEEILMIDDKSKLAESLFDQNKNHSNRIHIISQSNGHLLKEYVFKKLSQGLNNSMRKSTQNDTINSSLIESINKSSSDQLSLIFDSVQSPVIESNSSSLKAINNTKTNERKVSDDFVYQYQPNPSCLSRQQTCPSCLPLSSIFYSFDNETLSSESNEPSLSKSLTHYSLISIQQNLSQLSDDEDDIYEKYQTSFSHILHTICKEDKLQSMLVLEPNTSIITVRQLIYHPLNINNSMITSHICVRLIAHQTDLSIQCDTKPIGCKKSLSNNTIKFISINNKQQENINLKNSSLSSNKKLQATSIL